MHFVPQVKNAASQSSSACVVGMGGLCLPPGCQRLGDISSSQFLRGCGEGIPVHVPRIISTPLVNILSCIQILRNTIASAEDAVLWY